MNGDNTTIAYFGTTLYLLRELLGLILRREVGLKPQFKEQEDRERELKEQLNRQRDDVQLV